MKIAEALELARNAGPFPRKMFISRRDWQELFAELTHHPKVFKGGIIRQVSNAKFDHLQIFSAETNDAAVIREANRMADEENRKAYQEWKAAR